MQSDFSKKLRQDEAAAFLGTKPSTLERWRCYKKGPAYLKVGGKILYLEMDLLAFLESSRRLPAESAKAR